MKKEGCARFPRQRQEAEALYRDILNAAISNARRYAADMGIEVPEAILQDGRGNKLKRNWHMTKVQGSTDDHLFLYWGLFRQCR